MKRFGLILARLAGVALPLGLGVALIIMAGAERRPPAQSDTAERSRAVRVMTVERRPYRPTLTVYGSVRPARIWQGVAEVGGEIVEEHVDLEAGRLLEAGSELLRIDPTDYELARAQSRGRLASAEASLGELDIREDNLNRLVEIERRALEIARDEYERRQTLFERNAVSRSAVDEAEEAFISRRQRVAELENELRLIPARREVQTAEKRIAEAELAEAEHNIARTRVRLPFEARIAAVEVETGQFARAGDLLVTAEGIDEAEVEARLRLSEMRSLFPPEFEFESVADLSAEMIDAAPRNFGIDAELGLEIGDLAVRWAAEVDRVSFALEPETRTVGLVVTVDDPIRQAIPGRRPPLLKNMFVAVHLKAERREAAIVIPRSALVRGEGRTWRVRLVDDDNRLRHREVELAGFFGEEALIAAGLEAGERVVLSDMPLDIEGMPLEPVDDPAGGRVIGGLLP